MSGREEPRQDEIPTDGDPELGVFTHRNPLALNRGPLLLKHDYEPNESPG